MKTLKRWGMPPEETPETVREALELFRYDMMRVNCIVGGIGSQLDMLTEGEDPDWRRQAIERGMVNTLELLNQYMFNRIQEVDDIFMDRLPAGKPAKKIQEGTQATSEEGGKNEQDKINECHD